MLTRKPVLELEPGDFVARIVDQGHTRQVSGRFRSSSPVDAGRYLYGPRGGRYVVTAAGAAQMLLLDLGQRKPAVSRSAIAVLEGMET